MTGASKNKMTLDQRRNVCAEVDSRLRALCSDLVVLAVSKSSTFSEAEAALSMALLVVREQGTALRVTAHDQETTRPASLQSEVTS